jgi:hypothetical protein
MERDGEKQRKGKEKIYVSKKKTGIGEISLHGVICPTPIFHERRFFN